MKKKFSVELFYEIEYEIEAESEDEAIEQAVEYWKNISPNVIVRPVEEKGGKDITCNSCPYYYRDSDVEVLRCHYVWEDGCAPCEIDDFEEEEEDYPELIFDPEEEKEDED